MAVHLVNEFSFSFLESEMEVVRMEFVMSKSGSLGCFLDP